jgi:hypothetical protein
MFRVKDLLSESDKKQSSYSTVAGKVRHGHDGIYVVALNLFFRHCGSLCYCRSAVWSQKIVASLYRTDEIRYCVTLHCDKFSQFCISKPGLCSYPLQARDQNHLL